MNPARCKILVIQTDFDDGVHSAQLVASAKYVFRGCLETTQGTDIHLQPEKKEPLLCKQYGVMRNRN